MSTERYCWHKWVPGVISRGQVNELVGEGALKNLDTANEVGESAVDLVLGDVAYKMTKGAVKPFGDDYEHFLNSSAYAEEISFKEEIALEQKITYVFEIKLELGPPLISSKRFYGHATGRSSVGRVDVLTRLIVNGMDQYESFTPEGLDRGKNGKLFLEVTPITFPVRVKPNIALSQLRLFLGSPATALMRAPDLCRTALRNEEEGNDGYLSLNVGAETIGTGTTKAVTFRANMTQKDLEPIRLWTDSITEKPSPEKYWQARPEESDVFRDRKFVTIDHGFFYILRSKESLAVPLGVAVYCRPSDETIGEMRIHYAGFVHPGFGLHRNDQQQGTPLIFEVRGHDFNATLMHGEKLARLEFYRMSKDAENVAASNYEEQSLKLSKFFGDWK